MACCWPVPGSQIRTVRSLPPLASSSRPATVTGQTVHAALVA